MKKIFLLLSLSLLLSCKQKVSTSINIKMNENEFKEELFNSIKDFYRDSISIDSMNIPNWLKEDLGL